MKKSLETSQILVNAFQKVKEFIGSYTFKDEAEEIDFFKEIKPRLFYRLLSYCKIYNIECVPIFGEELDILIFYKTNLELEMFKTKKITDLTKKEFITILEEIGYTTEFNNNIRINFDSDENVQKNYQGNYGLRLYGD